jgi:hypothetical protein
MRLWRSVTGSYEFADPGSVEILAQSCQALDRAEQLAAEVARDGPTFHTARGPCSHPALKLELANRAFVASSLARLGLDLEPIKPPGRPPGPRIV